MANLVNKFCCWGLSRLSIGITASLKRIRICPRGFASPTGLICSIQSGNFGVIKDSTIGNCSLLDLISTKLQPVIPHTRITITRNLNIFMIFILNKM